MDFITRDGLVGAMQAWVFAKAKTLGELLVERGDRPPVRKDLLEALVEEHVKTHRGDLHESLAAVSPPESVARDLRAIGDADLDASMAPASSMHSQSPGSTGPYSPQGGEGSATLRYQILRSHAKGGLGEVFVALDHELHREVALKEIKEKYAHDPGCRSRFVLEAEITSGLEHPGIVPVYGLGQYSDGRPFYAMRFVRGETLKGSIQAFHVADVPGREPGERVLSFRQLLRRFIDACNAVAYAHSRGVLHRDLKPANIMLGPYGETLVVDWGLAKAVGRRQGSSSSEENTLLPASSGSRAETLAGTAIGTPAYMSPEQASGRLDALGPATDVYGLGATLYTLVTGKLPVDDTDAASVLRRVQRGEVLPPRRANSRAPLALEAVCLKAMTLKPEERYADALSLAADLEHWLADEPVSACKESFPARSRRWVRRHQALVGSAAAAALALLLCLAVGLGLVSQAYRLEKEAREYAVGQEEEATRQRHIAEAHLARMEERVRADFEVTEMMVALATKAEPPETQDELQDLLQPAGVRAGLGRNLDAATGFARDLAGKYQTIANSFRLNNQYADSATWYAKARSVFEQLATDHPDDIALAFELAQLYLHMGHLYAECADAEKAWDCFGRAIAIGDDKLRADPAARAFARELVRCLNAAGEAFQTRQDARTALAFHQRALAATERLLQRGPPDARLLLAAATTHNGMGLSKRTLGQPAEALVHHEKAKTILEELSSRQALSPEAARTLARTYCYTAWAFASLHMASEAARHHEKAVSLREKLANPNARDLAFTLELGDEYRIVYCLHRDAGDQRSCLSWCERAISTFERLAEDYPSVPAYVYVRDEMVVRRAVALARLGRHQEAVQAARSHLASRQLLPGGFYNMACVFAVAATRAREDLKLGETERDRLAQSYAAQATQLLTQAHSAGYFKKPGSLTELKNDADLRALRSTPEFKQLVISLEAAGADGGSTGPDRLSNRD